MEHPAVSRWIEFLQADAHKWSEAAKMCDEQATETGDKEWANRAEGFRHSAKECRDMIAEFRKKEN